MGSQFGSSYKSKSLRGRILLRWSSVYVYTRNERELHNVSNCEQRKLIFELSCDKETIQEKLTVDAAMVYKILQEKLAVETNSQHSTITAIFASDPSDHRPEAWYWILREQIKSFEIRYPTSAKDFDGINFTYWLRAKDTVTIQFISLMPWWRAHFVLQMVRWGEESGWAIQRIK